MWNGSGISTMARSPVGGGASDRDITDAATRFLYTGDPARLELVNCTRRVEMRGVKGQAASSLHPVVHGAVDTMLHATNFLNLVFQTNDIRESSVREDMEWYHALVRSMVEADPNIYRALLTLDVPATPSQSQLVLQATRKKDAILLQDLSRSQHLKNQTADGDWFQGLKFQKVPRLNKRLLHNDLQTLDTPKWSQGDSYMVDKSHVKWSSPFLDCEDEKLLPKWMVTMSTSFYGLKPDLSPEFKGVVRIDFSLDSLDIDQCSSGDGWFADSHRCDVNTTQCSPLKGQGFQLGAYQCICKEGYYNPDLISANSNVRQEDGHVPFYSRLADDQPRPLLQCLSCSNGCSSCSSNAPCFTHQDPHLRLVILSVQALSMLLVFLSMLLVYRCRNNKRIRASGLVLLETILGGSILLYFPVFILYFQPSVFRCVLLRWVRMLGFAIIYGTITLKIYRVLKVFLSRTAQRIPYMTCCRLLKMLAVIALTVCWFLVSWTLAAWENMGREIPLVTQSQTADGQSFMMCKLDRWDYMMATAELLFLCWGCYLCFAVRSVPSTYHEPRFLGLAIHNEILMSAAFYSLRFTMATTLHPDWMLLLFFIHTHLTVTMTLILLLVPKFLHMGAPLREDLVAEVYEDELDLRCSGSYLNSSITSAWSEHSLDPEDIRDELKKLYAQLEIHKTKKMTANNPHLVKKRSSRRGLGRSIIKRIADIPDSVSRQCSRVERGGSIGAVSHAGSYKKKFNEPASASMKVKEDSIKRRVFSIRKSHSTHDHTRGHSGRTDAPSRDSSLLDSLMRKKLAKKASQRSHTESVDAAPLVCKSASAHNLTVDKPPAPSQPGPLHKSHSVLNCTRDKALVISTAGEDSSREVGEKGQRKPSISLQLPTVITQPEAPSTATVCERPPPAGEGTPRHLHPPSAENNPHRHGSCSTLRSGGGVDRSLSSGKLDCRRKSVDVERKHHSFRHSGTSSLQGGKGRDAARIRSETNLATANTSPPGVGDSSKTEASTGREEMSPATHKTEAPSEKSVQVKTGGDKREKYMALVKQSSNSSIVCPWDTTDEDTTSINISVDQKGRSLSVCMVAPDSLLPHSSFKTKATNLSLKLPKGFGQSFKHLVAQGKLRGSRREKSTKAGDKVKGSPEQEMDPPEREDWSKDEKSQPTGVSEDVSSDASPLEAGHRESKRERYMSLLTNTAIICPWDVALKETLATSAAEDQKKGRSLSVGAGAPGSLLQRTFIAKDPDGSLQQNKHLARSLKLLVSPGKPALTRENTDGETQASEKSKVADICPWDAEDDQSKEASLPTDKSKGAQNYLRGAAGTESRQEKRLSVDKSRLSYGDLSTNAAIVCPWDMVLSGMQAVDTGPEHKKARSLSVCVGVPGSLLQGALNARDGNASLLQQNKRLPSSLKLLVTPSQVWNRENKEAASTDTSKAADVCPWDGGGNRSDEAVDICPWDSEHVKAKDTSLPIAKSNVAEICPWDSGDTKSKDALSPADKSKAAVICPWDSEDAKDHDTSMPMDRSKAAYVCPWDAGDSERIEEESASFDESQFEDVCPWDSVSQGTSEMRVSEDEKKGRSQSVCVGVPGSLVQRASKARGISDSLPQSKWLALSLKLRTGPGKTKVREDKGKSLLTDQASVVDICPWDMEDLQLKETSPSTDKTNAVDICPWDTEDAQSHEAKSGPTDKSNLSDVCPWEGEALTTGESQTGTKANVDVVSPSPRNAEAVTATQGENKGGGKPIEGESVGASSETSP
ncbi:probable G-protein coupled receptor 158 [Leucoraja erinacea]|uniref:probable G-protein coupled receptor 158 n=1 Tax=Leucoraja erinaceus TaxID=7782 RepID=UPI002457BF2B|nr:probable G-protein coupled receptor 158 [Leucoraja erinacea]